MSGSLTIVPWPDPVIDTIGHDPRSPYAETFWLPTLGPTSLLLLRHLANRFDQTPDAVELRVADASAALGVGSRDGTRSPIVRSLARLQQFDLAVADPQRPTIAVRRSLPPLQERHLRRLPPDVQEVHAQWARLRLTDPPHAEAMRRARRLALRLVEEGEDPDDVELILGATGFHPAISAAAGRFVREGNARGAAPPTPCCP
jgi:hypothetical protein